MQSFNTNLSATNKTVFKNTKLDSKENPFTVKSAAGFPVVPSAEAKNL